MSSRAGLAVPRQNGKNGVLEVRELYGMVALGERFLHTAHEVKTARKAFARLLEFFDNPRLYPELAAMVAPGGIRRTNGQEAVLLTNGGSVEFIARSKGSGRGFSVDVLVCDEAQQMSDDDYQALRPTISASPNPQVILTGTPPPPGRDAPVWLRMREAAVQGTDDRLAWSEWSCPDDLSSVDLDSPHLLAATNPALGVRLLWETVEDERDMGAHGFARERLGWWEPTEVRAAALPGWDGLADPVTELGTRPVFAVAAADDGSYSCLSVASRRPDGFVQLQTAEQAAGTAWLAEAVADVVRLHRAPVFVHASLRGVVTGTEVGAADYERACKGLLDDVEGRRVRHHGDGDSGLQGAVASATWTGTPRRLTGRAGRDICQLQAAALALQAARNKDDLPPNLW